MWEKYHITCFHFRTLHFDRKEWEFCTINFENHIYVKILSKFDFCSLLNYKNMLNRFLEQQVRKSSKKRMIICSIVPLFSQGLPLERTYKRHFHFIYNLIICHWIVVILKWYKLCIDLLVNFNWGLESMCYIGSMLLAPSRSFGKGHLDISQILKWTLNVHFIVHFIHSKTAYRLFICY